MTPGERRRRHRKHNREDFCNPLMAKVRQNKELLMSKPHPKIPGLTAYDYIDWCYWQGYSNPIQQQLDSL